MTAEILPPTSDVAATPIWLVSEGRIEEWLRTQDARTGAWVQAHQFRGEKQRLLIVPEASGRIAGALLGLGSGREEDIGPWHAAALPERLPGGAWRLATPLPSRAATHFLYGWLHGCYRTGRYRSAPPAARPALVAPANGDQRYALAAARACEMARELINAPANELGPAELAQAAVDLAVRCGAKSEVITGEALLARNYPLVHAVGAASAREPRLIDLRSPEGTGPLVTIVGKGVCFDSGGLDVKPSSGMLLMKKDMGGAACALALAQLLTELEVPVRWRVLIPAVENSIDGRAYRPGDVWRSRKGLTVEIGNTDAEGRLVLADALTEADGERPDLLIDLATLTGAARVALGPELPAAFSTDAALLARLQSEGEGEHDPVWPMPLWMGYDDEIASKLADLNNVSSSSFAGAIIGALFLKRFVTATPAWIHLDLFAWNAKERPGRPVGAEAQCVRALYRLVRARFG